MDEAADELYGLPPEDFTAARDERVRAARAAGDRKLAAALGRLRRPTVTAWVLNLLVRDQPEVAGQLVELGAELRRAQEQLSGPALRELASQRQRLVSALVRSARKLAAEAGHPVSAATGFELEQTLHAALADPDVAAEVGSGRLTKAVSRTGFEAEAPPRAERLAPARRLRAVRDDERAEDPAVVRERRRQELERERLQGELDEAEQARAEQDEALAAAEAALAAAERQRTAAEEAAEDLRTRLAAAEDAERDALRDEREAQRTRDGIARRRDQAARRAADLAARLGDLADS
ncbi:MAG TPA: hypothetical protein VE547_07695 [Mycobacteriales bacterium]|nr:hypothetical protein [Mycobacteriales bacterium]